MKKKNPALIFIMLFLFAAPLFSQADGPYDFTVTHEISHTPVKSQGRTGTCWSYATVSFIESEAIRLGAPEIDLSEMFIVRYTYPYKAESYVRLHGDATFGQGSLSHDAMNQLRRYGIVPYSEYTGLYDDETTHNHSEMFRVLSGIVEAVIETRRPSAQWKNAFNAVLDTYLGAPPEQFNWNGKNYTPRSFAEKIVKVNPDDYVQFTSYSYMPFYETCRLEVPDNWSFYSNYYNIPIDDLQTIADHALENGYTLAWDGDVSEPHYGSRKGYGVLPKEEVKELSEPIEEMDVQQDCRQMSFDNYQTTDDHLMHMIGFGKDQDGSQYYYIKDSGGNRGPYNGYLFMSKPYYRMKTTGIMVHKDAVPKKIRQKCGF